MLPVFSKDDAPESGDNSVEGRELAQQEPSCSSKTGGKDKEGEVGLGEGEVESNLRERVSIGLVEM